MKEAFLSATVRAMALRAARLNPTASLDSVSRSRSNLRSSRSGIESDFDATIWGTDQDERQKAYELGCEEIKVNLPVADVPS